jgi:hypothetical protein
MKKIFMSMILALALMMVANAQKPVVHMLEYESFANVKVSDDFIVKLVAADKYMVRTTVDGRIESYVKSYVQNGTLYISLDRKSFPSDLKKALRVKGAPAPILEVEISFPSIESMEMGGNSILHRSDVLYAESFKLTVNDKARVDKIYVDCNTAEVILSKNAYADVETRASEMLYVITSNSSKAVVKQAGKNLKIDAAGSSEVTAIAEVDHINVLTSSMSSVILSPGKADSMAVSAVGSSKIDAEAVSVSKASMSQSGTSRCYVNVSDTLKVNLTGNSLLSFKEKPYIDVERIVGSTLIKADDPKRR